MRKELLFRFKEHLKVLNRIYSPPILPYRFLVMELPGVNISRVPSRFAIPACLAASVLGAMVLKP